MRQLIFPLSFIAALLCLSINAYAGHAEHGHKHHHMQKKVLKKLNLDAQREQEVKDIMEEGREARKEIKKASREKLKALHTQQMEKLSAILSEEEMDVLKDSMHKMKKRRHQKMKKRHMYDDEK